MEENPPYITVVNTITGIYYVARVEWDKKTDSYLIVQSREVGRRKSDAVLRAWDWAKEDNLEVR